MENKEHKIIIYTEDNGQVKDKHAIILEKDIVGIKIQLIDRDTKQFIGAPFFLPWLRILKIKDVLENNE